MMRSLSSTVAALAKANHRGGPIKLGRLTQVPGHKLGTREEPLAERGEL